MHKIITKFQETSLYYLYKSFTPATRAVIHFAIPLILVDAIHYYTAGTALIFSFPLLVLIYLLCGALAARIAYQDGQAIIKTPGAGRSAGLHLWLTSTVINTLIGVLLGFASLGITMLCSFTYLCLFAPFHALGSALCGWLGGWLFMQYTQRTIHKNL